MENGLYPPRLWSFSHRSEQMPDLILCNNGMESFQHYIKTQINDKSINFAAYTKLMSSVETLRKIDYESYLQSDMYVQNSQSTVNQFSQTSEKHVQYKGQRLWPSSCLMKFLFDNRSKPVSSPESLFTEVDGIMEEFLQENSFEILASLNKLVRNEEDSVKDILDQESLHMNLEQLIEVKKEEKRKLKKEHESQYPQHLKKLKKEAKIVIPKSIADISQTSQDSAFSNSVSGVLPRRMKQEDFEKESDMSSQYPSQYLDALDVTRSRVDMAERIMALADDDKDSKLFSSSKHDDSQNSGISQYSKLLNMVDNQQQELE